MTTDVATAVTEAVTAGYAFEGPALELGALMVGPCKTKTLQLLAEQLSAHGVPVFAADIEGDLSGLAMPGEGEACRCGPPSPPSGPRCCPRCSASTTPRSPPWGWSSITPTRRA